jgi:ABC-type oligopeptide transport system substrate-binding subunit
MKKVLLAFVALFAVFMTSACKPQECDTGYHLDGEECVLDDTVAPVITAPSSYALEIHQDFDPLVDVDVSAVDDVDGPVSVTVKSSDLNVDEPGSFTIVYEAVDAAGNSSTATMTVSVMIELANHLSGVDLGKVVPEEKAEIFAAAERYLMENLYGGVPLWTAAQSMMFSDRVQLYTTTYNTVMGYGTAFSQFTEDDSNVLMDGNNYGNAGEYTWRSDFNVDPVTLNPWLAEDAVSSNFIGLFTGSLYSFYFDASKTGYEILGEHAKGEPVPVNPETINGKVYSKVWQIELKDNLKWYFHPDIDTSALAAGYDQLDASDYLWTWETALEEGWFRAYSGGGDFISAGIKNAEAFYKGTVDFSQVGLRLADGKTNTLEVEFTTDKSAFDIKYMFAGSQTAINKELYDVVGEDYGTTPLTVASSGIYYFDVWTPGQLLTFKKNPEFVNADMYHFTGQQFRYIKDENSVFAEFLAGRLDSATVPSAEAANYANDDRVYKAPDAATWRLNFNMFGTEANRDAYIAEHPEIGLDPTFVPEPILQYLEMRQAIYYGIDRETAAVDVVKTFLPATTYMSGMYFLDAESGLSIRGTAAGQAVEDDFAGDSYGYFPDAATSLFKQAVTKALADGFYADYDPATATAENPYEITFLFTYHTPDHVDRAAFVNYITTELEKLLVDDERHIAVKFDVRAVAYPDHYDDYLMVGATDMGIGAISGSLLDAPSFLDVFNDDMAGGFTLNWGIDTHTPNIPITYTLDGKLVTELWSYNAIAKALNGKTYIKDGVIQEYWDSEDAIIDAYLDMAGTTLDSKADGSAIMQYVMGKTPAELAAELEVDSVSAWTVTGADGSNFLYIVSGETGQYELVDQLSLFDNVVDAVTADAGYAPDGYAKTATLLADDAAVAADAYAQGLGAATLADLFGADNADVPTDAMDYAEAYSIHWDFNAMGYGEWDDIYVVLHIGDFYIAWAWL